ncbi:hypothetical protein FDECE_11985 [Fusarium decemcellulare]|nr:hypothetical protein FDECE_11985 [Fusarium decemcellulare]
MTPGSRHLLENLPPEMYKRIGVFFDAGSLDSITKASKLCRELFTASAFREIRFEDMQANLPYINASPDVDWGSAAAHPDDALIPRIVDALSRMSCVTTLTLKLDGISDQQVHLIYVITRTTAIILRSASIALDWGRTTKWPFVNRRATTPEESESESDTEPDAEPDVEQTATSVDQEDLMDGKRLTYRNEGFKYHANKDGPDWVPGLSTRRIAKRNDGGDPDTSDRRRRGSITKGETVRPSLCRKVARVLVWEIRQEYILAADRVSRAPNPADTPTISKREDLVKEAMRRRMATDPPFRVTVADYNGTIKSLDERAGIVRRFNLQYGGPQVLLLSAAAGGTGLNLAGASRVILCEPFWAPGLKQQTVQITEEKVLK